MIPRQVNAIYKSDILATQFFSNFRKYKGGEDALNMIQLIIMLITGDVAYSIKLKNLSVTFLTYSQGRGHAVSSFQTLKNVNVAFLNAAF